LKDNLIGHNLDVMHIEKNVFDNIFNTVMDVKGKTIHNEKARKDLELYCKRRGFGVETSTDWEVVETEGHVQPNCPISKISASMVKRFENA